jgi:hypothetical protein
MYELIKGGETPKEMIERIEAECAEKLQKHKLACVETACPHCGHVTSQRDLELKRKELCYCPGYVLDTEKRNFERVVNDATVELYRVYLARILCYQKSLKKATANFKAWQDAQNGLTAV